MKATDFLTILGLGLAVWAIIPKKERKFVLLFFSKKAIFVFAFSLIFLHFLFSFEWLLDNWFPFLKIFTLKNGLPNDSWAYILSITLIFIPVYKVVKGYFSKSRLKDLLSLYDNLLKNDEIEILSEYVERYHIDDIQYYLKTKSHFPEKSAIDYVRNRTTEYDKKLAELIKPKKILFAQAVYYNILLNKLYISKATPKYPELFAKAFGSMESKTTSNRDAVKQFIEVLFETKNPSFIRELKIVTKFNNSIETISIDNEIPILYSLFSHTDAAQQNQVWYPVGEKALKSLKYDKEQIDFLIENYDADLKSELWNYKTYIAVIYFDYMVRETIYKDSKWHMWLFYYSRNVEQLLKIIDSNKINKNNSFAHYLITEQIDLMIDWLSLAKEQEVDFRVIDTIRCLGQVIDLICSSNISNSFKKEQLRKIISLWFNHQHTDNKTSILIKEWITKLFLNPKNVDYNENNLTKEYIDIVRIAWNDFDKFPYRINENEIINEFTSKVLNIIDINE